MKRIIAIVLVLAFAMAFVPAAFAAPAEKTPLTRERNTHGLEPMQQTAIDNDGTVVNVSEKSTDKVSTDFSSVNEKYQTIKASDFNDVKTGWKESERTGIVMVEQEDSLLSGHWLDSSRFTLTNDWYTSGKEVYTSIVQPIDDNGELHEYMKGETVWMNYDIYKDFDMGSQMPVELGKKAGVSCYVFAGTREAYAGESEEGIVMKYEWLTGGNGLGIKMTAPEDNYVYMFVFIVQDSTLSQFGSWISISSADETNDFKKLSEGEAMTVGKPVTTDIGGQDTNLTLAPWSQQYVLTYGAKHAIELEAGKMYLASFDSSDSIGARVYFCDENMDIMNQTWIGSEAVANGTPYSDCSMAIMPVLTGTYYIVTCGFYIKDEGELEATVTEKSLPYDGSNLSVNLDQCGTENYIETIAGIQVWGYFWDANTSLGELIVLMPCTLTVTGSNENIYCDIYDGVNLILDNATIGPVWAANTYAPAAITAKGDATISNSFFQFTVYNYEGCYGGLYILGDTLTVESREPSQAAITTVDIPVHIGTKELNSFAAQINGVYPIAIWVIGKNFPELALGNNAKFADGMKKTTMYYDGDSNFQYGFTVSEHEELFKLHNTPTLMEATLEFTLTTDGFGKVTPPQPPVGKLGDANEDGVLNTGDAVTVLKHAASMITLEGTGLKNADYNQDGLVNTGDAVGILKYCAQN